MEKELIDAYNNNNYPGIDALYRITKGKYTRKQVADFLRNLKTQQLFKKTTRSKKYKAIVASQENQNWQCDLIDLQDFSKKNKGYKYILTVIDVFSRFAYAEPLKNKTGPVVLEAFKKVAKNGPPHLLTSDNGSEFINKQFQDFLKDQNITHITVDPGTHTTVGVIERFNQTLKNAIFKYFQINDTNVWIDKLPRLIRSYNNRYHSTIQGKPKDSGSRRGIIQQIYAQKNDVAIPKLKVGDQVRIIIDKGKFKRGFKQTWSEEIYKIETSGNLYKLEGLPKKYHYYELQTVGDVIEIPAEAKGEKQVTRKEVSAAKKQQRFEKETANTERGKTNLKGFKALRGAEGKRTPKPNKKYSK